ncbi:MAG: GvpL/GvpF family gas vesicle protein [Desulfobacteraceae bacterium]|nr:GvpL/GvpF family gas vesicle protein [Desulfobacteraceae bacterium]
MTVKSTDKTGKYLYAIVGGPGGQEYGPCGIGGEMVYSIAGEKTAAVVSDIADKTLRPERRNLATHRDVLKLIMEETTPLPMAFGIIASSRKAIQKILYRNHPVFAEKLAQVKGKVEMGLRVTWDVPNIFEYFVEIHPELKDARNRYFSTQREPTQDEKIELGRMFERALNEDRVEHTRRVEEVLSGYCHELKENRCREEREVLNLACLVGRNKMEEFEKAIFEAAELFDNSFAFDYNGPWAPHNFVHMNIEL